MAALERLITRINIEMTGDTKRYLVSAKQGDKATRYVIAKLLNDGMEYIIPSDARVAFNVEKPDGKYVYNTCTHSGSEVTVELTNQTLAVEGTAYCDIEVRTSDNTQLITTASFTLEIEKARRNEKAIQSSNEFTELESMINDHVKRINDTDAAVKNAETLRVIAENERVEAEKTRSQNENARINAENLRSKQEQNRQEDTTQAIKRVSDAVSTAETLTANISKTYDETENLLSETGKTLQETENLLNETNETLQSAKEELESTVQFMDDAENKFNSLFENIKEQLNEDAAGNLQNQINSISAVLREITDEEIDAIVAGTYIEDIEGGMEPDIYSRVTDAEIENVVNNAFRG